MVQILKELHFVFRRKKIAMLISFDLCNKHDDYLENNLISFKLL